MGKTNNNVQNPLIKPNVHRLSFANLFALYFILSLGTYLAFTGGNNLSQYPITVTTFVFTVVACLFINFFYVNTIFNKGFAAVKYLSIIGVFVVYIVTFCSINEHLSHISDLYISMVIFLFGALIYIYYLKKLDKLQTIHILIFIALTGAMVRIFFSFGIPWTANQHDISGVYSHTDVIKYIAMHLKLNDSTNQWQFSHPQVHYIIYAVFYRFFYEILKSRPDHINYIFELLEIVAVFFSVISIIIAKRILSFFNLSNKALILGVAFFTFFPSNILMSRYLNNDSTLVFFTILTLYQALKWYQNRSLKSLIFTALFASLTVSTKSSGIIVLAVIGFLFLGAFIKLKTSKERIHYGSQLGIFALVYLPIPAYLFGRMMILFKEPFGYVNNPGGMPAATGLLDRFYFPLDTFSNPFAIYPFDNNIATKLIYPEYVLKTSLFGEFAYNSQMQFIGRTLLFLAYILLAICLVYGIKHFTKKFSEWPKLYFIVAGVLIPIIAHICMCIKMPFACSYNYRYLAPFFVICAIILAKAMDHYINKNSTIKYVSVISLIAFLVVSVIVMFWIPYSNLLQDVSVLVPY
ncbi:MAG: phospholipid carrier-dependent glycosyltransferase [Bacillota bacterium]|nr:phospholipid carrier-dependent glycosyltransferase [Bacillota bacterium]